MAYIGGQNIADIKQYDHAVTSTGQREFKFCRPRRAPQQRREQHKHTNCRQPEPLHNAARREAEGHEYRLERTGRVGKLRLTHCVAGRGDADDERRDERRDGDDKPLCALIAHDSEYRQHAHADDRGAERRDIVTPRR